MLKSITKLLIANRGEIACRIIRTAHRMGIETVAVYSDADRQGLHVKLADEAIHIGPSPATQSYLAIEKIISAGQQSGAQAIHPGYGFLSENPDFVRACKQAGLIFIGPSVESIEAIGLKDTAKALMDKAGVPITPGYHGDRQNTAFLQKKADETGYPILIKAVAGGGGKGMRKVDKKADFSEALAACQREAQSSFGDARVLIEKYISAPRHIEVQVFGDHHGHIIHLFERDCSVQRRHQKVIEEAPAPGMDASVRKAMTTAAIQAAKTVQYIGAGTVEFIADGSAPLHPEGFWFMEMNTRLQVEHPVTEMITGLDIVEWQIRVAQGEKLPDQTEIKCTGHAVEARLYAEDPAQNFLPSTGHMDICTLPADGRIDKGVMQGDEISLFYDPMIAKIIAHESDRSQALSTLEHLCRNCHIYPVKTNARFLADCLAHTDFMQGSVSTHFITEHIENLLPPNRLEQDIPSLAMALIPKPQASVFARNDSWRLNLPPRQYFIRKVDGQNTPLPLQPDLQAISPYISHYQQAEGEVVFVSGQAYLISTPHTNLTHLENKNILTAPMSGKVTAIKASAGEQVTAGQSLIFMEAMKMEIALEAPRDGLIRQIHKKAGELVSSDDILLTLEEEDS